MYPSPATAYRPQLIPQVTNQHPQPPPPSSSTYPHPQYNNNSNLAASANTIPQPTLTYPGHPGQPPPFPQPMPYAMGGSTTATVHQPMNNINAQFLVSITIGSIKF
jgi:hypothetical protein